MAALIRDRLKLHLMHLSSLLKRPVTLGVKAVVCDVDERILLVRHGYLPGWHFPGGGVEAGETCSQALARELEEEAMITIDAPPLLHGVFHNVRASRRDHVVVYLVQRFRIRRTETGLGDPRSSIFPAFDAAAGDDGGHPGSAGRDLRQGANRRPLMTSGEAQIQARQTCSTTRPGIFDLGCDTRRGPTRTAASRSAFANVQAQGRGGQY